MCISSNFLKNKVAIFCIINGIRNTMTPMRVIYLLSFQVQLSILKYNVIIINLNKNDRGGRELQHDLQNCPCG